MQQKIQCAQKFRLCQAMPKVELSASLSNLLNDWESTHSVLWAADSGNFSHVAFQDLSETLLSFLNSKE